MNSLALTNSNLTGAIYFRIYAYASGGPSGTWRLDNVNLQGTIIQGGAGEGGGWYIDTIRLNDTVCCQ